MKRIIFALAIAALFSLGAQAQTPAPSPAPAPAPVASSSATGPFTITAGTATITSKGTTTPVAVIQGLLQISPNFRLRDDNLLAPGVNWQSYMGGVEYSWLHLIKKSTLSLSSWDAYAVVEGGASRVVPATGPVVQHFGLLGGGGLRYDPTASGHFSITIGEVALVRAPGLVGGVAPTFRSSINWNLGTGH